MRAIAFVTQLIESDAGKSLDLQARLRARHFRRRDDEAAWRVEQAQCRLGRPDRSARPRPRDAPASGSKPTTTRSASAPPSTFANATSDFPSPRQRPFPPHRDAGSAEPSGALRRALSLSAVTHICRDLSKPCRDSISVERGDRGHCFQTGRSPVSPQTQTQEKQSMINTRSLIGSALAAATTLGCGRSLCRPGRPARVLVREVLRRRQGRPERLPDRDAFLRRHVDRRQPGRFLGLRARRHLRQAHRRQQRTQGLITGPDEPQTQGADRCLTRFQPSRSRKQRASVFARRTSLKC